MTILGNGFEKKTRRQDMVPDGSVFFMVLSLIFIHLHFT